eukprot:XP_019918859.1 PREDICTED: uncharacterized protein LOC109617384 [Crassostrea gigas]
MQGKKTVEDFIDPRKIFTGRFIFVKLYGTCKHVMVQFQSFTTLNIPIFGKPAETNNENLPYVLQTLTKDSPKSGLENEILNSEPVEENDERTVPCKVCNLEIFKNLLLKNQKARKAETCVEASSETRTARKAETCVEASSETKQPGKLKLVWKHPQAGTYIGTVSLPLQCATVTPANVFGMFPLSLLKCVLFPALYRINTSVQSYLLVLVVVAAEH